MERVCVQDVLGWVTSALITGFLWPVVRRKWEEWRNLEANAVSCLKEAFTDQHYTMAFAAHSVAHCSQSATSTERSRSVRAGMLGSRCIGIFDMLWPIVERRRRDNNQSQAAADEFAALVAKLDKDRIGDLTLKELDRAGKELDRAIFAADRQAKATLGRFHHFSLRIGHRVQPQVRPWRQRARREDFVVEGGCTTVAHLICQHSAKNRTREEGALKIGLMVAANSGRPGGRCGCRAKVAEIHSRHTTQEEDVVANWMVTEAGMSKRNQDDLYQSTIYRKWGLRDLDAVTVDTLQGVDYVNTDNPEDYGDAWVIRNARVSSKTRKGFDTTKQAKCHLVFCAGPNAGATHSATGSTSRTLNQRARLRTEYAFFRNCLTAALRTALDAMISEGVQVALLARISCGLYAGPHRARIVEDFNRIVDSLLEEPIGGTALTRGQYFERVIVPLLP